MDENARVIHETMVALGFERDRSQTRGLKFRGVLNPNNLPVQVEVLFADATLSRIPKLKLVDRARQFSEVVAHIEDEDRVCYAQDIEMQLDPFHPDASVTRCIHAMIDALARMLTRDLSAEIAAEFPQHWRGDRIYVAEEWPKSGDAKLLQVKRAKDLLSVLGKDADSLNRFGVTPAQKTQAAKEAAPVRVIRVKNPLTFKHPFVQPTMLHELLKWAASVEFELDAKITTGLAEQPLSSMRVFLAAPNGMIGAMATPPPALVKAQQTKGFGRYLIQHYADKIPITRLTGDRADERFVIDRNLGGKPGLDKKRIAVIGLGTIGGELAKLLAQAGAGFGGGYLSLMDQQVFSPGNVGRHILGIPSIGLPKASACCAFLKVLYPGINAQPTVDDVLRYLDELERYDLVVDATGDQPVSRVVNEHLVSVAKAGKPAPARLHVWLEGNGVAARALLVDDPALACLDCLNQADGSERFRVIRPEHPAALTPANCGEGAYFAYGLGPSGIAAGLAVQIALDWAAGVPSPRLRTIRINEAATFQTKDQNPAKLTGCRVCAV
jgi:molybdopterin/thiamine biosynthesis adenylyltransferase